MMLYRITNDITNDIDSMIISVLKDANKNENTEQSKSINKEKLKEHHHTKVQKIDDKVRISICPSCLWRIITHSKEYPNYCTNCGQRIDWSDINGINVTI